MTDLRHAVLSALRTLLWVWDHSIGWILRWFFMGSIRGYQLVISPLLPPSCRYHPSCSSYGYRAIAVHGSAKGLMLATWRLLRCNPWTKGGVDPVPLVGRWLPEVYPDGNPRSRCEHAGTAKNSLKPDVFEPVGLTAGQQMPERRTA